MDGIGQDDFRRAIEMTKNNRAITLLVVYLVSCVPAQCALVVCVRPDGTARFASANHACADGENVVQECHTAASRKAHGRSAGDSVSRDRCCEDYPVGMPAEQLDPKDLEKSAPASVDSPPPAHFAVHSTCGRPLPVEFGPEQTFPTHLKTIILLI